MINNGFYLKINDVAKILDVSPATIRNWEKNNLFVAKRNKNNYREYSQTDIELLKKIKHLSIDKKLNIISIKKTLDLDTSIKTSDMFLLNTSYSEDYNLKNKSNRDWKALRNKKKLTLEELSSFTKISTSYLSKIEANLVNPSLEVLTTLSNFYNIPLMNFSNELLNNSYVTRKNERTSLDMETPGVYIESLIHRKDMVMRPTIFTALPSSGQPMHSHSHSGEAFIHVLEGEVTFTLDESKPIEYILGPGDSITFQNHIPHSWKNKTEKKVILIWVHTQISLA
ncbi:helix-turn-helix domain-containing protein [Vagococcus fluvialis]|uniref:helix-turn-helix domain-containing protein n=1 Tax=Vagococcus fluvialis TaxID=2738 RepID=UPI001A8E6C23|nr:helix-turn-helix domain-containing protein [Vagococcus fluvialis]MBO0436338.1 MerR family transcriptional regulator [Vagococcus fluvialis]